MEEVDGLEFIRPLTDNYEYRHFVLDNGMKVSLFRRPLLEFLRRLCV